MMTASPAGILTWSPVGSSLGLSETSSSNPRWTRWVGSVGFTPWSAGNYATAGSETARIQLVEPNMSLQVVHRQFTVPW